MMSSRNKKPINYKLLSTVGTTDSGDEFEEDARVLPLYASPGKIGESISDENVSSKSDEGEDDEMAFMMKQIQELDAQEKRLLQERKKDELRMQLEEKQRRVRSLKKEIRCGIIVGDSIVKHLPLIEGVQLSAFPGTTITRCLIVDQRYLWHFLVHLLQACVLMFAFILVHSFGQTQCTGTFGRDFHIGILKTHYDADPQFSLLITSNMTGTAIIYIPHLGINTTRSFNQSLEYKVTGDTITTVNTTVEHKGIHVTTDVDVTLTVMKYPRSTRDGFLALPAAMLSTDYIISSYQSYTSSYYSDFLVLALQDDTLIDIHVEEKILRVVLNRLGTYLVRRHGDLSGARVISNTSVAVFSGHEGASVPVTCGARESFVKQLLPTKHFAQEFIVPPVPPQSKYVVRIYSSSQNTSITFRNTTNQNRQLLLKAGDFYEILSGNDSMNVFSNKPVQVMLYSTCFNDAHVGDVFMSIVPAINQYRNSYHFSVIATNEKFTHYLTIIAKTEDISGLRINGNQMGNIFYSYVTQANNTTFTVNVYKLSAGEYHLYHVTSRTFGAIQYGFGGLYYSYGYPLGIEVYKESIGYDGLKCFDCTDMTHLYLCDTVTKCSSGQVCHVETYRTNSGQVKYNSGCLASEQCSSKKRQTSQSQSECVHCCSSSLCNSNVCGAEGLPPPQLRGPLCYDCSYVSNMDECRTVRLCSKDEVCSVEKYDWGGVYDHYTAKCHNKQCISHKRQTEVTSARESRSTPVCKTCCDADLCNTDCSKTSQNGTGVIIVG